MNHQKYAYCRDFLEKMTKFLRLDSKYNVFYHYVAINRTEGKLYEIHTRVVGFEGEDTHTKSIEDFVFPPRELTIEEFLEVAEKSYLGISVLYSGINKDNLHLYQNMIESWYNVHWKDVWTPLGIESRGFSCVFQETATNRWLWECKKGTIIYPLVAISEFFVEKGFVFETAIVGGGADEITHGGTISYSAQYLQLDKFKDEFQKDLDLAYVDAKEKYGGWAFPDYKYITVILNNGDVRVNLSLEGNISVEWSNTGEKFETIIEETKQKMIDILGKDVEIKESYFIRG